MVERAGDRCTEGESGRLRCTIHQRRTHNWKGEQQSAFSFWLKASGLDSPKRKLLTRNVVVANLGENTVRNWWQTQTGKFAKQTHKEQRSEES